MWLFIFKYKCQVCFFLCDWLCYDYVMISVLVRFMWRFFVVVFEIAALITIFRLDFVQYFMADIQDDLSQWMFDIADMPVQRELTRLREEVAPHFQAMRPYQRHYLDSVMSSKTSMRQFHYLYCERGDKNPYIYGASLRYFCGQLSRSELLDGQ